MNNQQSNYTFTPHDLRIGNVVNYHSSEDGLLPTTIDGQDIATLEVHLNYFNSHHSPIPITVEMLVEVGYRKHGLVSLTYESNSDHRLSVVGWPSGELQFCIYGNVVTKFTYLHELQNLHYDFTREMLTLKSKA